MTAEVVPKNVNTEFHEDDNNESEIKKYFCDKVILLTGATGFLGGVVLEKLLRSCPSLRRVYVLIRKKKNKDVPTRLKELLSIPVSKYILSVMFHSKIIFDKNMKQFTE